MSTHAQGQHPLLNTPPSTPPIRLAPPPPPPANREAAKGETPQKMCVREVFVPCPDERTRNCTRKEVVPCD